MFEHNVDGGGCRDDFCCVGISGDDDDGVTKRDDDARQRLCIYSKGRLRWQWWWRR